ncbi:MAG: hypothetical protein AB7V39_27995, partial [Nitrospiraceae bacterium]
DSSMKADGNIVSFKLPKKWHYAMTISVLGKKERMLFCSPRCRTAFDKKIALNKDYERVRNLGMAAAKTLVGKRVKSIAYDEVGTGPRLDIEFETGDRIMLILHHVTPSSLTNADGECSLTTLPKWGQGSWAKVRQDLRDGRI